MPTRVTAQPHEVMQAVRQRILDKGLFSESLVFWTLEPRQSQQPPPSDLYLSIVSEAHVPNKPCVDGGGNTTFWIDCRLTTVLWVRLWTDQAGRSDQLLMDRSFGGLVKQVEIVSALNLFDPVNNDGDWILCEPMRLAAGGWTPRPAETVKGWTSIQAQWEAAYLMRLETLS